nr:membrane protein insertase YidC [Smithellaceae bacterium]
MDKRTILAVVLSLAVLFVYQMFFAKPPEAPKPAAAPATQTVQDPQAAKNQPAVQTQTQPVAAQKISVAKETGAKNIVAPKDIKVETAQYTAIFSTKGGALKSFQLKNYQKDCADCADDIYPRIKNLVTGSKEQLPPKKAGLVELVDVKDGMPYPLAVTFPESSIDIAPDSIYEANTASLNLTDTKEKQNLVFTQT